MSGWPPCAHTSSAPCLRDSVRICSRVIDVASRSTSATVVPAVLRPSTTSPMDEPYGRSTGPSQVLAGSELTPSEPPRLSARPSSVDQSRPSAFDSSSGCEAGSMLLTVQVPGWELEENGRILSVGDRARFWLTFAESQGRAVATELVNVVRGVAVPLPTWPGAEAGRYPVRIDIDGGALYWDAPKRVTGHLEGAGTIRTDLVDAPAGFPETSGVVRRVRMVWADVVMSPDGTWRARGEHARYEEVTSTYLPVPVRSGFDSDVEAALRRAAREAYDRDVADGRLSPGAPFEIGLKVPPSSRGIPAGAAQTRWAGALLDLETVDSAGDVRSPRSGG